MKPTIPDSCVVGPAFTVRDIIQRNHVYETARQHVNKIAEFEAHNLARPGDVVVIDGVAGISNMGGISAQKNPPRKKPNAKRLTRGVPVADLPA